MSKWKKNFNVLLWCFLASPALGLQLTTSDQKKVDLTVYKDFVVVRDVRETVLPVGLISVEFQGIAETIDPGSVQVSSSGGDNAFEVIEQTYEYDLLNKQSLLKRFIGHKLKYSRSILQDSSYEKILREGILLSIGPEIVKFGDMIEIEPEGVISLPYVPETLKTTPTLSWRVDNRQVGPQEIVTSYVAEGMGWYTDYRLTLDEAETAMDFSAWVNLRNETGVDYKEAAISVIAGKIRRVAMTPGEGKRGNARVDTAMMMESQGPAQALSDYYIYDLDRRVNLASHQTRQVKLMSAEGIAVEKKYISANQIITHRMPQASSGRFDIELNFVNGFRGSPGVPLPAGRASVFKAGDDGVLQLLGEDRIPDVPSGEMVRLSIGQAFDLVIERTQTEFRRVSENSTRLTNEVVLRNRKDEDVTMIVREQFFGDWIIISQTEAGEKLDSVTQEFVVDVKAGATRTFTYTAEITF
ncbi:MAG: DUF4139 domain-containing protein [Pseudomonadales bacterium]